MAKKRRKLIVHSWIVTLTVRGNPVVERFRVEAEARAWVETNSPFWKEKGWHWIVAEQIQ